MWGRRKRIKPGPGQESVWDYPRPPALEPVAEALRVEFAGEVIAATEAGYRVLETSHPPVYYFPPGDMRDEFIEPAEGRSLCEWKGVARYWTVRVGEAVANKAAWSYPQTTESFARIRDYLAFYASRVDACYVGDERVVAQAGDFYGGWVTSKVVGPFKGEPGSRGW